MVEVQSLKRRLSRLVKVLGAVAARRAYRRTFQFAAVGAVAARRAYRRMFPFAAGLMQTAATGWIRRTKDCAEWRACLLELLLLDVLLKLLLLELLLCLVRRRVFDEWRAHKIDHSASK